MRLGVRIPPSAPQSYNTLVMQDLVLEILKNDSKTEISNIISGSESYLLSLDNLYQKKKIVFVTQNSAAMELLKQQISIFNPNIRIVTLAGWDCLPYDRISPGHEILTARAEGLAKIALGDFDLAITTVNSLLQKTPCPTIITKSILKICQGSAVSRDQLIKWLIDLGYARRDVATDSGEFAVRGGLVDIITATNNYGIRIDFFGNNVDVIKTFDPTTQISNGKLSEVTIFAGNELILNQDSFGLFQENYLKIFGKHPEHTDRKFPGMEHYLPLFYKESEICNLFEYFADTKIILGSQVTESIEYRFNKIEKLYQSRLEYFHLEQDYLPPLPLEHIFITREILHQKLRDALLFGQFSNPHQLHAKFNKPNNIRMAAEQNRTSVFEELKTYVKQNKNGETRKKHVIAAYSEGSKERLVHILENHDFHLIKMDSWLEYRKISGQTLGIITLPLEQGFETGEFSIISEQDLLGERIIRKKSKKLTLENLFIEQSRLEKGELVVHKDHGIALFDGIETLQVLNKPHDCLKLIYAGNDKLYIPIENIELLTKYGSQDATLDRLGTGSWQKRKAILKNKIKLIAEVLIKNAAQRHLVKGTVHINAEGPYDEFCANFPYIETDDQLRAIDEIEQDLSSDKKMDRLICGDVGFGKTEVAMRAAFIVASSMNKQQVVLVAPTTLLVRQHYANFLKRFHGFDVRIRQLSRMVKQSEAARVKQELAEGRVDIIIATHAILSKDIKFHNLGLVIVDEEHHFGVAQKEKFKELRANTHILALSATPIPRTLQMSLVGIRDLSLIATPPVDRQAIKTFVVSFDPVLIREAILKEYYRGGKSFYVAPRISDLKEIHDKLTEIVPEVKIAIAHGKMQPAQLDQIMNDFYDNKFDMLLSTTIIESGIDIQSVNSIFIHRAEMFGLAALYQLRGRVGRGKTKAYAYLITSKNRLLSTQSLKRLEFMQTLDSLGSGFNLAAYDMDIRGFGNLVGEEQSGHIKEVGVELYQEMLNDAIMSLSHQSSGDIQIEKTDWTPQILVELAVLIPELYIEDLSVRMGLYSRASYLKTQEELNGFVAELIDRFGNPPQEVSNFIEILSLKLFCKYYKIDKLDLGPKALVLRFRDKLTHPEKLITYMQQNPLTTKIKADNSLVIYREISEITSRTKFIRKEILKIFGDCAES